MIAPGQAQSKMPYVKPAMRWKWHHFYFILALFDVLVIITSLVLYDQALHSYRAALSELSRLDECQHWFADLGVAVVRLNAPGNDVFESRDVARQRERFEEAHVHLNALTNREGEFDIDLSDFRGHITQMVAEETAIFDGLETLGEETLNDGVSQARMEKSVTAMAAMDRFQAGALAALARLEVDLLDEEDRLYEEFGHALEKSAMTERLILPVVILILIGVFLYGRKLQKMHEQMTHDRERAIIERSERFAAIGELCSAVAHGIRNPLAAITSSAQLALQYGTLDDDSKRRVLDVLEEGRRLGQRISRLLEFADSHTRSLEPFDLRGAVQQAVTEVRPRLDERQIAVKMAEWDESIVVHGNREWIVQCAIELLSNTIDHLDGQGQVTISCSRISGENFQKMALLVFQDDGPGVKDVIRERIFDLFFTSKDRGIGIGLASVKRAVEFHGGTVRLVDANVGARFEIQLPL